MSTAMDCVVCRPKLDALIDDELTSEEIELVRAHLAVCTDCARTLESRSDLSRLLRENLVHYTAPDVLKARIRSALAQSTEQAAGDGARILAPRRRWAQLAAAGIAIAIVSSGATIAAGRAMATGRSLTSDVLTSHVRSLMPQHLVDVASNDQHNVKPWFNGRLALSPPVPLLDSANFRLVGGRLDYLAGHPAAVVVYARRQHLINVYAWPHEGADRPESSHTTQGYHLLTWRSNDVEFWAVSDLNSSELSEFTRAYRGTGAPR